MPSEAGSPVYVAQVVPSAPSGTPTDSPTSTPAGISLCWLWRMEVRLPAGHQGYTGLALVDSGAFVVPKADPGPAWIVGDNDLLEYPYNKELGANVVLLAYNTGTFNHTWQVRLFYTPSSALDADGESLFTPDVADWLESISELQ